MILTPPLRKLLLTVHLTVSVGWVGALAVFLAHAAAGALSPDEQIVRAASVAMGMTAWFVILPLSVATLATGLVQALGTAWGLLRHYWIVFKLMLTTVATIVLFLKLGPISSLAEAAATAQFSSADFVGLRMSILVHAAGGLLVLLAATTLAVYKPSGMTWYGAREQRTPVWVKIFSAIVVVLVLLVCIMLIGGEHGPGTHTSSGS